MGSSSSSAKPKPSTTTAQISTQTETHPVEESFPNILHLLQSKKHSDVTLRCGGKNYEVHSKILEAHSDTFKALFLSLGQSKTVAINDMVSDVLEHMLHFLYSGNLVNITLPHALKLYEAARAYEIRPLEMKCLEVLKVGIREDNVCDILNFSDSKGYGEVKDIAIDFLVAHKKFLVTETWNMFAKNKHNLVNSVLCAMARRG